MRVIPVTPGMDMLPLGRLGENECTQFVFDVSEWLEEYPGASISLTNKLPRASEGYPCTLTAEGDGKYSWTITSAELTVQGDGECELQATKGDAVIKGKIYKTKIGRALDDSASVPDPWESWITELTELQEAAEDAAEDADDAASDAEAYAVGKRGGTDVESTDPAYHNNSKYYSEQAESSASAAAGSATTAGNKASDSEAYAVGKRGGQDVESGDAAYHNNSKYYSEQAAGSATAAAASAAQAGSKANRAAIAKEYADLTYPVAEGTWCWHENVLYEANQAISTSETWTAAHWTAVTVEGACGSLKTEIANKADIIISSASGSVVSFSDGVENLPLEDCVVQITPVQDTSGGDPSHTNICPISGWTGANVYNKNAIYPFVQGSIIDNTGADLSSTTRIKTDFIPYNGETSIALVVKNTESDDRTRRIYWYDSSKTFISSETLDNGNQSLPYTYTGFTAPTGSAYFRIVLQKDPSTEDISPTGKYLEINPVTYTITWQTEAGTVYRGTRNLKTGVLIVTDGYIASYNGEALPSTWISDRDVYAEGTMPTTGAQVVYKLATPITYQFDPITIRTLLGENHIFADTGDVSAKYRADTKKYVDGFYKKPSTGIPSSDMASAVQTSLGKANTAYQKPVGGIPLTDLADNTETVSGTTPSITGVAGHRYICGECATLTITAPASGIIDVVFESGSTPTVLTVSSAIKWANGFDPSSLEANTVYELNILDGELGVVGSWT